MRLAKGKVKIVVEFFVPAKCAFNPNYKENGRDLMRDVATDELFAMFPQGYECQFFDSKILDYEEEDYNG